VSVRARERDIHISDPPRLVRVGIDAAVVAQHEVCVRATDAQGRVRTNRFRVQPTLAGLRSLSNRLAEMPGVIAVAEPTSMTWLGLSVALAEAGCDLSLLGVRHAARLRGAISGKQKSDVIDADVLGSGRGHSILLSCRCVGRMSAAGRR
jgi:hypothetical protein